MKCRYCCDKKKLVKAHIIPEAFFRRLRDGQDSPRMFSNKAGEYPKRAPIGVYDTQILCKDCELIFGDWDNYAQDILREEPKNSSPILNGSQVVGYQINSYNYDLLKLFFISLSWRASVSAQPFYKRINLGPYEKMAKYFIEHCDPGSENDFSVTLAKFDHSLGKTILDPHIDRWDGVNYIRFYLGSYVAYIKTDKRKAPEPHLNFILRPNQPLIIIGRDLEKSKELPLIKKIVTVANKRMHCKA
jgi:hypothetical protein